MDTFTKERNGQLAALSTIMRLLDEHFPLAYSEGIYNRLDCFITLDPNESLEYDENRKRRR